MAAPPPPHAMRGAERQRHFFTVDIEEHFQVSAFEGYVSRADWDSYESRVQGNVDRLLEILDRHQCHGTFFVLGWIAERRPNVVRSIATAGHEIASHGCQVHKPGNDCEAQQEHGGSNGAVPTRLAQKA